MFDTSLSALESLNCPDCCHFDCARVKAGRLSAVMDKWHRLVRLRAEGGRTYEVYVNLCVRSRQVLVMRCFNALSRCTFKIRSDI